MATNMFKKYTPELVREWVVPANTLSGVVVIHATSSKVGITLTGRGDATKSYTAPNGLVVSGIPAGGVGNRSNTAVVATDGSWLLTVVGVTAGDTTQGTATAAGTLVYRTPGGTYTLTASGNTAIGRVDSGWIKGTVTPVQLGTV